MKSFEESYALKQESRKRPKVHFYSSEISSSSESESEDFKNIKKLSKKDAGLVLDMEKKYNYNSCKNDNNYLLPDDESDGDQIVNDQSMENDEGQSSESSDQPSLNDSSKYLKNNESEDNIEDNNEVCSEDDGSKDDGISSEEHENCSSENGDNFSNGDDGENHITRPNNSNLLGPIGRNNKSPLRFESTNQELQDLNIDSLLAGYNEFNDERRLPFIEKAVMCACQQLEENKAVLKEIKENTAETKSLVQNFIAIMKDLAVEVFDSKEEIKKRNGMFTDILMPDFPLHIMDVKEYNDAESALQKHKVVDSMVSVY